MSSVLKALCYLNFLLLLACTQQDSEILKQGIIYCSEGNPETFNPQLATSATTIDVSAQLYESLVSFDEQGQIVPAIAKQWHISEDNKSYTFFLEKGIHFHNSEKFHQNKQQTYFRPSRSLNADDILFSFNRWRLESHPYHLIGGANYPYFDSINLASNIKDITKLDSHTVKLTLEKADSTMLSHLATQYAAILSAEYGNYLLDMGTPQLLDSEPIGTGPFYFHDYHKDVFIRFKAHQHYWREKSKIERLIFDITPRNSARLAKLLAKECDVAAYPDATELAILKKNDSIKILSKTSNSLGFWAFNTEKKPFNNIKVRQALSMAIDKNAIVKTIYGETGMSTDTILTKHSWAHSDPIETVTYNPKKAKALLKEAGIEGDLNIQIWAMPIGRAYNPNAKKMAELIKAYLAKIGVSIEIISYEWSTFRRLLSKNKHDSVLIGWSADMPDPDNFFTPLLSCSAQTAGGNRANWCSQEFDALLNKARFSNDRKKRKAYYKQAQEVLSKQLPLLPIAHTNRFLAISDKVTQVNFSSFMGLRFNQAEKR